MATQLVRNVVKDSGQNPIANSQVRIYLVAGPAGAALDAGAEASIGTPHVPSTSRAGYWAASLQPNAGAGGITNPTGTYYRVVEPSGATWTIQLNGDVAPPVDGWWVGDPAILVQDPVSPPPVVAGVTSAQLTAAADGAQAAATAAAATDATTKANAAQANAQLFTTAQLGNYATLLPHVGTFVYDGSGRLTGSTDGLTITYDGSGRVSTISDGTTTRTLNYTGASTTPASVS